MDVELLISSVFSRPAIWDKRSKLHSNRQYIDKCWMEITKELNEDETKLKKKWKYLRDQFAVELGKFPPARSGDAASLHGSRWPFFQSLLFLRDVVTPRRSSGNLTPQNELETMVPLQRDVLSPSQELEHIEDPVVVVEEEVVDVVIQPEPSCSGIKQKKRHLSSFNEALLQIEEKKLEYLKEKRAKKLEEPEDDEHLLFFKSLLPHVRKIPEHKQLTFRSRIQEIVEQFAYNTPSHFYRIPAPRTTLSEGQQLTESASSISPETLFFEVDG